MASREGYEGREQSLVKHFILETYLERFAHIIGSKWTTLSYIDCFCGPWESQRADYSDTSFAIAVRELQRATQHYAARGRRLDIRCLFLEANAGRYAELDAYARRQQDVPITTLNRRLTEAVPDIEQFLSAGGRDAFPFVFIDPTGWDGFPMDVIGPLLRHKPSEVLVNFMTEHIRRWVNPTEDRVGLIDSFTRLFGSPAVFDEVSKLADPQDREDSLFLAYARQLKTHAGFEYVCPAVVLHPVNERTYFHLIYATRSLRGVEVFKQAERKAFDEQEEVRKAAAAEADRRRTGMGDLFADAVAPASRRAVALRERYLAAARAEVEQLLTSQRRVPFDLAWATAVQHPLVWDSDVKEWVREWREANSGTLEIEGLKPGCKVPQVRKNHVLVWREA